MSGTDTTPFDQMPARGGSPAAKASSSLRRPSSAASIESTSSSRPRTSIDSTARSSRNSASSLTITPYDRQNNPSPEDRVFPVRSVVSVDPSQTPFLPPARLSGEHDGFPGLSSTVAPGIDPSNLIKRKSQKGLDTEADASPSFPRTSAELKRSSGADASNQDNASEDGQPPSAIDRYGLYRKRNPAAHNFDKNQFFNFAGSSSNSTTSTAQTIGANSSTGAHSIAAASTSSMYGFHVTARFKHIVTDGGHAVIMGRDGDTVQRCEDEPIHIPGAVQGFGLLVALEEETEGKLVVRVVSENSEAIIGYAPHELFALSSFTDILSEEQADNLLDHIDFIRDEDADIAANGPEVFTISLRTPAQNGGRRKSMKLWCAMHINPKTPNILICEFELDDDEQNPLVPPNEPPDLPEDTLESEPTHEELLESTHSMSKPLRVLRSARRRKGEAAAMEVFNIMSQVQEQLASAPNLEAFLKILCGVVKELTGFHRVMIYQFDGAYNGRVVTELVDPRATKDLYKGLNFPASDIPKQARELYKINKVRLLYDRDLPTARLVCKTVEDLEKPLDLTFSYLRAMSPVHIKYLANMAVRSSMSISINAFGELWGLIALHGYGAKGMRVSFPIRKMCRLVGDTASRNIERLSYASRLQARKLINTAPSDSNPSGHIVASSDDLLKLFDSDFGLLSIHGETKILGKPEQTQELLAMLEYLRLRSFTTVLTSDNIKQDFPDAPNAYIKILAGLLLVPLSIGGSDFIVFFRRGQEKEVKWAGNPYEKYVSEGTDGYLEPRKSFKTWTETVVGKCREWSEEQIETAAVLCLVYGKFIEVWRQKEAALQSSQLTRLLLANSAHEVRTPLNAIINYLEIALEGKLDQETRDNLTKSHSASKSLIYVINDLLDLTKTEEGQALIKSEVFDLPATIREATDIFKNDAKRKNIEFEVTEHPGVPQLVHGDQRRVRQAVSNITANAIKHTNSGSVRVETSLTGKDENGVLIDIVIQDTGSGMSNKTLDALFRDLEQVSMEYDSDDQIFRNNEMARGRTLGLGLATVARIVRNCGGNLRVKSEEGKGTRFICQLPFDIPEPGAAEKSTSDHPSNFRMSLDPTETPPALAEGEVMLVDRPDSFKTERMGRLKNIEEAPSIQSLKSNHSLNSHKSSSSGKSYGSHKSDVDRLIDAIQEPLAVGRDQTGPPSSSDNRGSFIGHKSRASAESLTLPTSSPKSERPSVGRRAVSSSTFTVPEHMRSAIAGPAGSAYVQDNKTPIKAIRIPDEFNEPRVPSKPRVIFDLSATEGLSLEARQSTAHALQVLVAEDDPINSRIILKRLEKSGHSCHHTVNGEECATAYGDTPENFDVILMDMQMPLVDGLTSTKMIRSFEKSQPQSRLSPRAALNTRIPIFAVSASLVERELQTYISAGFDGWILKPIDFKRLNVLLTGIVSEEERNSCLYEPGQWERGGWFQKRQLDSWASDTRPSGETPVKMKPPPEGGDGGMMQPDVDDDGGVKHPDVDDDGGTTPQPRVDGEGETIQHEVAGESDDKSAASEDRRSSLGSSNSAD